MSKFIPDVGSLFYVECKPFDVVVGDMFSKRVVKVADNSYCDRIFRAQASDSRVCVAVSVNGFSTDKPQMFICDRYEFYPVGPAVAAALNVEM